MYNVNYWTIYWHIKRLTVFQLDIYSSFRSLVWCNWKKTKKFTLPTLLYTSDGSVHSYAHPIYEMSVQVYAKKNINFRGVITIYGALGLQGDRKRWRGLEMNAQGILRGGERKHAGLVGKRHINWSGDRTARGGIISKESSKNQQMYFSTMFWKSAGGQKFK